MRFNRRMSLVCYVRLIIRVKRIVGSAYAQCVVLIRNNSVTICNLAVVVVRVVAMMIAR